jgi:hypothetical protein
MTILRSRIWNHWGGNAIFFIVKLGKSTLWYLLSMAFLSLSQLMAKVKDTLKYSRKHLRIHSCQLEVGTARILLILPLSHSNFATYIYIYFHVYLWKKYASQYWYIPVNAMYNIFCFGKNRQIIDHCSILPVPKCLTFDYFDTNSDHSYYSKYEKNQI